MTDLEKLLRYHVLDSRNSGEEAIAKLRLTAADRIAELERELQALRIDLNKVAAFAEERRAKAYERSASLMGT